MNFISIQLILDNILDLTMLLDVKFERAVNYTVELIRLVGVPTAFDEKYATIEILRGRGKLPCDCYEILGVKDKLGAYRYTTDTFHTQRVALGIDRTYKRQKNFIFLSTDVPTIDVAYTAFMTDEYGLPMVPDDLSFALALEYYIKKRHFESLLDQGKISPAAYNNAETLYCWYVGLAQAHLNMLTPDQMESITAMLNLLITKKHLHTDSFAHLGTREYYRKH